MHFFAREKVQFTGEFRFTAVGLTAAVAAVAAVALTIGGARRRDGRTVLVGTAFSAMAALLALHGIATPGVLGGYNGVVAFTAARPSPSPAPCSPSRLCRRCVGQAASGRCSGCNSSC
jgi:hypothetical protein